MPIPEEYTALFDAVTDAIEELERLRQQLIKAQQRAEELFMDRE